MAITRQSLGLAALAATSTLGAWLMYNQYRSKTPKKVNEDEQEEGPFDFVVKPKLLPEFSESASSLNSDEIEQALQ
jgi:hypothetical protein